MANIKAALKSIRQNQKRQMRNSVVISELRTLTKKYLSFISSGQKEQAFKFLPTLVKKLDRAATKKIIHPNASSRKKSRLMKRLNQPILKS